MIATVVFNRPEALNALNYAALVRLGEFVEDPKLRRGLRAVFFRGNGRAFSVGADLKERRVLGEADVRRNRPWV